MVLYSNQRFSEYMQSWNNVDDKKNLILNFKTVTREPNPKKGSLNSETRNIPGDRYYTMKKVKTTDDAGRTYYLSYKMKQPYAVDLTYNVSIITNKYELINEFNQMVNEKFKAINCYIRPKGHFIPMKLNDISDNSENSINDREFYSQTYNITVMGYIVDENSFEVVEEPELKLLGIETESFGNKNSTVDIVEEEGSEYVEITVNSEASKVRFDIDTDMRIRKITCENINSFKLFVNDKEVELYVIDGIAYEYWMVDEWQNVVGDRNAYSQVKLKAGDEIKIKSIKMCHGKTLGKIKLSTKKR